MNRAEYVRYMEAAGFPAKEAEKMADFALMDFDSYDDAHEYYRHSEKFLLGMVYAGHRKARRLFLKRATGNRRPFSMPSSKPV